MFYGDANTCYCGENLACYFSVDMVWSAILNVMLSTLIVSVGKMKYLYLANKNTY